MVPNIILMETIVFLPSGTFGGRPGNMLLRGVSVRDLVGGGGGGGGGGGIK